MANAQKKSKNSKPRRKPLLGSILVVAVVLLVATILCFGYRQASALHCETSNLPVKTSADGQAIYSVTGWLCARGSFTGKTVQLLVSGVSYDHNYWDFPYQPNNYSYVRAATKAGYATFNFDRIGVGLSDKPPANDVTIPAEAYVAHELIQDLRQGKVSGTKFANIIAVGHSMGASILSVEGGTYNDANGLILADSLHQANTAKQAQLTTTRYPAVQDPKFKDAGLPDGYLTTKPGTRGDGYYDTKYADPNVVAKDEELKQTATTGEFATLAQGRNPQFSKAIKTPVLLVVGQNDSINCNEAAGLSCKDSAAIMAREKDNFSPAACLEAFVLPNSGHDTNLHYNAKDWFKAANDWADKRVGKNSTTQPTDACRV
jgi:pimeloyl-ACP methyl ester carboxylesterase